jgi:multidrug efflux pump subunit AcrA (membrane-fusion protein)
LAKGVAALAVALVLLGTAMSAFFKTTPLYSGNSAPRFSGHGTVLPAKLAATGQSTLFADMQAQVASVLVAPGDMVNAGQVIARLESPEITVGAEMAEKQYERARQRLSTLQKSTTGGILREEYLAATRRVEAARERASEFNLPQHEQAYTRAKARAAEMQVLLKQGLATSAEASQSLRDEESFAQVLASARQQWSQLKRDVEEAEAQLRIVKMRLEQGADAELALVHKEFERATIDSELAVRRLASLEVVAPRKGTVLAVNVAPGDRVIAGSPLFQLSDLAKLDVEVSVSARVAREIKVGNAVKVRLPTEPPREIDASVARVLLVPDAQSQGYQVKISIPNPDPETILAGLDCAVVFPHLSGDESWLKRLY